MPPCLCADMRFDNIPTLLGAVKISKGAGHSLSRTRRARRPAAACGSAALSFILPVLILLSAYIALGVYPFGEKSLLLVDMYNEYIHYFAYLGRALGGEGSLLRSWQMGMGLNMTGLIAFYAASPLNLIVALAPVHYQTEAVLVLTLLKIGLCGLAFYLYARKAFPSVLPAALPLAVAYALSGYTVAYSSNIHWLDGVMLLPIAVLGTERLLCEKKWGLLAGSLVYIFFTSYYIAYMTGIFLVLYMCASHIAREGGPRGLPGSLARLAGCAALAAGCCAFLLLPAFLELVSGQSALWNVDLSWSLDIPLTQLAGKLLPGAYDSLTDAGLPNIYSSVAGLLGAVLFFCASRAHRPEKLAFGALAAVLLLSFSCDILDLAWHAFEVPTWFPARYSFLFTFLVLHLALRGAQAGGMRAWPVVGGAALLLLLFLEAAIQRHHFLTLWHALPGMGLVLLYGGLFLLGAGRRRAAALLLTVLVCAECALHAHGVVQGMDEQFGYKRRAAYTGYRDAYAPVLRQMEALEDGVSRVEIAEQPNANAPLSLGYRGISHYSTTTDQGLNALLRALGYNTGTINEVRFAQVTPLTNGLLGVRWLLARDDPGGGYEMAAQTGDVRLYRNTAAFPLAFFADGAALSFNASDADPFAWQNALLKAAGVVEASPCTQLEITGETLINLEREQKDGYIEYRRLNPAEPGYIDFTVANPDGREAYAFLPVHARRFAKATAYVNGGGDGCRELAYRANTVLSLGSGDTPRLRMEINSARAQIRDAYFYALDLELAAAAAQSARDNALRFSRFDDMAVDGTVTAPRDGAVVTSFPYDSGWYIEVDGEKVQQEPFAGVFLAFKIPQGTHGVCMRYSPPGFLPGMAVSCLSVAVWLLAARRGAWRQSVSRVHPLRARQRK